MQENGVETHAITTLPPIFATRPAGQTIEAMVRTAINEVEENADLVRSILVDCGLCARIVEAFQGYDLQDDKVFFSAGYFGHLQMLAEELSASKRGVVFELPKSGMTDLDLDMEGVRPRSDAACSLAANEA